MGRFQVSQAAAHELLPACRVLFRDGAEHCRDQLLARGEPTALFVARDADGKLHAAALVQVLPGALGVAWPTRGDSRVAEDAVTRAACEWLRSHGVKVCQAFAAAGDAPDMAPLERDGFRHTTQLVMLRRMLQQDPPASSRGDLQGIYYLPAWRERFSATILATHQKTLDCPELITHRTGDNIIAGFGLPEWPWSGYWLATAAEGDVGMFAVEYAVDRESLELTYLGVIPTARGRGYGDQLVRRVLYDAAIAGLAFVTLSVDARNAPARKLYARHGFVEYDRREVWLASWPS